MNALGNISSPTEYKPNGSNAALAPDSGSLQDAAREVMQIACGYWISRALHVAADLALADLLKDGPLSSQELASLTDSNPDALYRILRSLAGFGVFSEVAARVFALTRLSRSMLSDAPGSIRPMVLFMGDNMHWKSYEQIRYSVRTGKPVFDHVFGKPVFEYLNEHPDEARIFDDAMTAHSESEAAAVGEAYDFTAFSRIADIAGGNGRLLGEVQRQAPRSTGVLFDLPHVIERAKSAGYISPERTHFVSGDFFQSVPSACDLYIMKHIIHDWDDEPALRILQTCRRAMTPNSRLLLLEIVMPEGNEPSMARMLDLEMLVLPGGRERTADEYRYLLACSGMDLTRIVPTAAPISIIEAVPSR